DDGTQGIHVELEAGDDTEVASAASKSPEEVGILVFAGRDQLAFRGDHVHRHEAIDGEAVPAHEVAKAAAKREPANAGRRDDAARGREAVDLELAVEDAPGGATLRTGTSRL